MEGFSAMAAAGCDAGCATGRKKGGRGGGDGEASESGLKTPPHIHRASVEA